MGQSLRVSSTKPSAIAASPQAVDYRPIRRGFQAQSRIRNSENIQAVNLTFDFPVLYYFPASEK